MRYLLILLVLMLSGTASAIDCEKVPDCESLGYSTEDDTNCADNGYMFCPFNHDYKKCVQYNCEKLGFTEDDKKSWCKNIATCRGNEKYTLCVKAFCEIGDVFYSDGSCGLVEDFNPNNKNKIPVGVVFWVTDNGFHGKVINLKNLGRSTSDGKFDPKNPYQFTSSDSSQFQWGSYGTDISGLQNWNCVGNGYADVAKTGDHRQDFWLAGESYTKLIVETVKNNLQYAAPAARAFYPPEVSENNSNVGKGRWYLPTLGELMDLYGYDYSSISGCSGSIAGGNGKIKTKVNTTLKALKGKGVEATELSTGRHYWSSSEHNDNNSWEFNMSNGIRWYGDKHDLDYVRASLQF